MDQALANRPYEVAGAEKHQRRLQPHRPLRGFKATASSCDDSQTAHATHSTPSPPHSRQDHETPTSPQTPDNKLHHRHAKIFKSPLRQTPPIVDQHESRPHRVQIPILGPGIQPLHELDAALSAYCTGAAVDARTLGSALNRLRGRRLVHQLPRGRLTI